MTARQAPPFHPDVIAALQSWLRHVEVQKDDYESLERLVQEHLGESRFQSLRELVGGLPDLGRAMAVSIDGEQWRLIVSVAGGRKRKPDGCQLRAVRRPGEGHEPVSAVGAGRRIEARRA